MWTTLEFLVWYWWLYNIKLYDSSIRFSIYINTQCVLYNVRIVYECNLFGLLKSNSFAIDLRTTQ